MQSFFLTPFVVTNNNIIYYTLLVLSIVLNKCCSTSSWLHLLPAVCRSARCPAHISVGLVAWVIVFQNIRPLCLTDRESYESSQRRWCFWSYNEFRNGIIYFSDDKHAQFPPCTTNMPKITASRIFHLTLVTNGCKIYPIVTQSEAPCHCDCSSALRSKKLWWISFAVS